MEENQETMNDVGIKSEGKKKKANDIGFKKLRITLSEPDDSPFNSFLGQLKTRGVKNFDISELVSEALNEVEERWWQDKLEDLTPIEFKLQAALENPEMREKIISVLNENPA